VDHPRIIFVEGNLLSEMCGNDVKRIVFASSGLVYGNEGGESTQEMEPTNPFDSFSATNVTIEQMLEHFYQEYGLNSVSLRFFNASGLDGSNGYSDLQKISNSELVGALDACRPDSSPAFQIPGGDHPTADGTTIKEYLHVRDTCDAHAKAMGCWLESHSDAHIFNLGAAQGYSSYEVISTAEKVTKSKARTVTTIDETHPSVQTLSSKRANKELTWQSTHNLEEIMKTLWQVMKLSPLEQSPEDGTQTSSNEAREFSGTL
jgi:UDP-glucose 4-epimerase